MINIHNILEGNLDEARNNILNRMDEIVQKRLHELKKYVASEQYEVFEEDLNEAKKNNPNIVRMGRVTKIRRRIRRNKKGKIVIQRNRKRSSIKGYRVTGNTVKRISAMEKIRKRRLLKRSWKTTRRAKLRRTLLKRKMSMRRRKAMGLK